MTTSHIAQSTRTPRITKVQKLLKMCGPRMTAFYLRNRGYSLDETLVLMYGKRERFIITSHEGS